MESVIVVASFLTTFSIRDDSGAERTDPLDLSKIPTRRYAWNESACDEKHYNKPHDSSSPYFHCIEQLRLFKGGLDTRPMYQKHKWVNWSHMEKYPQMQPMVQFFEAMGLRTMMELHQD
jgi:hypothetical protein